MWYFSYMFVFSMLIAIPICGILMVIDEDKPICRKVISCSITIFITFIFMLCLFDYDWR